MIGDFFWMRNIGLVLPSFCTFSFKVPPKPFVQWLLVPRFISLLGLTRVYVAARGEGDKAVWKTKAQLEPALTY